MNDKELSIQEELHYIKHDLKVAINQLDQIKKHIWNDEGKLEEPSQESEEHNTKYLEEQAVNYVHNVLIPDLAKKEAEKGDMVAQSAWIEWAFKGAVEYLKTMAMKFIIKTLTELKDQAIPIAIDGADWVLDQLENVLVNQYQKASEEQKQIFKNKIQEKFPNSRLLGKLN